MAFLASSTYDHGRLKTGDRKHCQGNGCPLNNWLRFVVFLVGLNPSYEISQELRLGKCSNIVADFEESWGNHLRIQTFLYRTFCIVRFYKCVYKIRKLINGNNGNNRNLINGIIGMMYICIPSLAFRL